MKLHLVTPACARVQAALDHALTAGDLRLPPELQEHLAHCPACAAAADATQELLSRLRSAPAGLPLTLLPGAVNTVLKEARPNTLERKRLGLAWFLGQLAALGGILILLACLLIGFATLIMQLLGNSMQSGLQPVAQALGSPPASLLLGRETHLLLLWDYIRCLMVPKNPLRGAAAPTGGSLFSFALDGVGAVSAWLWNGCGTGVGRCRHGTGMVSAWGLGRRRHGDGIVVARLWHGGGLVPARR